MELVGWGWDLYLHKDDRCPIKAESTGRGENEVCMVGKELRHHDHEGVCGGHTVEGK